MMCGNVARFVSLFGWSPCLFAQQATTRYVVIGDLASIDFRRHFGSSGSSPRLPVTATV